MMSPIKELTMTLHSCVIHDRTASETFLKLLPSLRRSVTEDTPSPAAKGLAQNELMSPIDFPTPRFLAVR